jgi:hypothetical protein
MMTEFLTLHPKLQMLITYINWWGIEHGEEPTWTEFLRSEEEQLVFYEQERARLIGLGINPEKSIIKKTSVHIIGRGADFRPFKDSNLNTFLDLEMNERFPYDPARPLMKTLLFHEGNSFHGHVQVFSKENNLV